MAELLQHNGSIVSSHFLCHYPVIELVTNDSLLNIPPTLNEVLLYSILVSRMFLILAPHHFVYIAHYHWVSYHQT